MDISIDEAIQRTFTERVKYQFLSNIQNGLLAFRALTEMDSFKAFMNFPQLSNFMPGMRAYAITRQFALNAELPSAPYSFTYEEVLPYKYKISFINMEGAIATIAKTHKDESLPNKSKYKLKLCEGNVFANRQLSMFDNEEQNVSALSTKPYYFIVTYGVYGDHLKHARIIVPSQDFKTIYESINLMDAIHVVQPHVESEQEEMITKIKKELLDKLNKGDSVGK